MTRCVLYCQALAFGLAVSFIVGCSAEQLAEPGQDSEPSVGQSDVERAQQWDSIIRSDVGPSDAQIGRQADSVEVSAGPSSPPVEGLNDAASPRPEDAVSGPAEDVDMPPIAGCGNGMLETGEACDDGDANSDITPNACRTDCTLPRCGDGVVDDAEACDDANEDETDTCLKLCILGPSLRKPDVGEVVITELMIDPLKAEEYWGEWVELRNVTDEVLSLVGCQLIDESGDQGELGFPLGTLVVTPHSEVVLGPTNLVIKNGGVLVDGLYANLLLANTADSVGLQCGEELVDVVSYDALSWPILAGRSLSLSPEMTDTAENDEPAAWCAGSASFGLGDLGTPGVVNGPCPLVDNLVDTCGSAVIASEPVFVGDALEVQVDLIDAALVIPADLSTVRVEVAWLGDGQLITEAAVWTPLNLESMSLPNAVSFDGEVEVTADGTQRLLTRASIDQGLTWSFCDGVHDVEQGAELSALPQITALPHPCEAVVCEAPPGPLCMPDHVTLRTSVVGSGACVVEAGQGVCAYETVLLDCGLMGQICDGEIGCYASEIDGPESSGEVVLTELMIDPEQALKPNGQWVELYNPSTSALNLKGCVLAASPGGTTVGMPDLIIGPLAHRVVGRLKALNANGGVALDWEYGAGFELPSDGTNLSLICADTLVDTVTFAPGSGWVTSMGATMSLSPFQYTANANDAPSSWCLSSEPFGLGDMGSPGSPNPACPGDLRPVDSCVMTTASPLVLPAGVAHPLYMQLSVEGITGVTSTTDPHEDVLVELWWATEDVSPQESALWSSQMAAPFSSWDSGPQGLPFDTDVYVAELLVPAAGSYQVTFRASADGGNSWRVCDRVDDGEYAKEDSLRLDSLPSACQPHPCPANPPPACLGGVVIQRSGASSCELNGIGEHICTWTEQASIEDCAAQGASCVAGVCTGYPVSPQAGDVIFTEVMVAPSGGESGEWFELSVSDLASAESFQLQGCEIHSAPDEVWSLDFNEGANGVLQRYAPRLFARSVGQQGASVYGDEVTLDNMMDTLELKCGGVLIDAFTYDVSTGWPIALGEPMGLGGNLCDATANDHAWAWCRLSQALDGTSMSSPGIQNALCPPHDQVVNECFLDQPEALSTESGALFSASLLVFDEGMTDETSGVDPAPGVAAEIGVGPVGSNPSLAALQWSWMAAYPDPYWQDDDEPGFDHWTGPVVVEPEGAYDLAMRLTLDGGQTWTYCDLDGSSNGYQPEQSGSLDVSHAACAGVQCGTPPAPYCDGDFLRVPTAKGQCAPDPTHGGPDCAFVEEDFDCAPFGGCIDAFCQDSVVSPTAFGQLVITEFLRDSPQPAPDHGEWVELLNAADTPLDLRECTLEPTGYLISGAVPKILWPGQYAVLGSELLDLTTISAPAALVIETSLLALPNVVGSLQIQCNGAVIDDIDYSLGWPGATGASAQLSPSSVPPLATTNDTPEAWCESGADGGSPGGANPPCED